MRYIIVTVFNLETIEDWFKVDYVKARFIYIDIALLLNIIIIIVIIWNKRWLSRLQLSDMLLTFLKSYFQL